MPLFIYVSGYASGLSIINWDKIKRRAVQLLIPFFNFAVLNSFLHRDNELLNWILFPEKGLWFLWALFFITQIHLLCHKVSSYLRVREEIIVIIAIIFLFSSMRFTNLFGYSIVCKYFIFYILGVYSRRRGWITLIKGKTVQILLLALFLFSISFFRLSENPTFCAAGASSLYKLIYNPLVAILGIMAIVPIFKRYVTDNMWITKIGGGKTLGIYAIHFMILELFPTEYIKNIDPLLFCISIMLLWGVVLLISLLCCNVCERNKISSLLILGKKI